MQIFLQMDKREEMIEQEPFRKNNLEEPLDTFTVRLNPEERKIIEECKKILEQEKDSTAIKQLAWLGAKVLHDDLMAYTLGVVFRNKRNNKRVGVQQFES